MKTFNHRDGFTLIEIIVAFTIVSFLIVGLFKLSEQLIYALNRNINIASLNKSVNELSSEFLYDTYYTSYTYNDLLKNTSPYDFENQFRSNIKSIIEKYISENYNTGYTLDNPIPCSNILSETQELSESDLNYNENIFFLNKCNNDINSDIFNENSNILVGLNKTSLDVYIYFVYKNHLHRIFSNLDNNLGNNNIINTTYKKENLFIYNDFYISKFNTKTTNKCNIGNISNCSFYDFNNINKDNKPGIINLDIMKFTIYGGEVVFPSSSKLNTTLNLN